MLSAGIVLLPASHPCWAARCKHVRGQLFFELSLGRCLLGQLCQDPISSISFKV